MLVNRLRIGMRLQVDPTIIYGLGDTFDGNLRKSDLLDDGPYNTYTRAGLPPTPIAMPGPPSLRAAVRPGTTKALYYVSRGDGCSQFRETLDEHNRAVAVPARTQMSRRGKFITLEGVDGAGKSTHIDAAGRSGCAGAPCRGLRASPAARRSRSAARAILDEPMDALAETLLVFAARRDHVRQVIGPALERGTGAVRPLHRCDLRLPGRRPRLRPGVPALLETLGAARARSRPDAVVRPAPTRQPSGAPRPALGSLRAARTTAFFERVREG